MPDVSYLCVCVCMCQRKTKDRDSMSEKVPIPLDGMCVCHNEKKVPGECQARQATHGVLVSTNLQIVRVCVSVGVSLII